LLCVPTTSWPVYIGISGVEPARLVVAACASSPAQSRTPTASRRWLPRRWVPGPLPPAPTAATGTVTMLDLARVPV
jgi:hypothetical protein